VFKSRKEQFYFSRRATGKLDLCCSNLVVKVSPWQQEDPVATPEFLLQQQLMNALTIDEKDRKDKTFPF
jgi:hypothetical protein